jgi:hypothetical protein
VKNPEKGGGWVTALFLGVGGIGAEGLKMSRPGRAGASRDEAEAVLGEGALDGQKQRVFGLGFFSLKQKRS